MVCGCLDTQRTSSGKIEPRCYENKYVKFAFALIVSAAITLFAMAAWAPNSFAGSVTDLTGYGGAVVAFVVSIGVAGIALLRCAYTSCKNSNSQFLKSTFGNEKSGH